MKFTAFLFAGFVKASSYEYLNCVMNWCHCDYLERECLDPEPPVELGEVHASGKFFGSKATYM